MNRLFAFVLFLLMTSTTIGAQFGDRKVDEMYQTILDTSGLSDKEELGLALGAVGSPAAKEALKALLEDSSYWNRRAGAAGLFEFDDADSQALLVAHLLDDHMISSLIEQKARRHWPAFFPAIKKAYTEEEDENKRMGLLKLIQTSEDNTGFEFIKSIVEQPGSADRVAAYRLLSDSARPQDEEFLRSYWSDAQLQLVAMDHVLTHGSAADMKLFQPFLEPWQEEPTVKAYMALNKWGSDEEKEQQFFDALSSSDGSRVLSGLASFTGVRSDRILERLGEISKTHPSQTARRLACLDLLYFNDQRIVPYLERFLEEPYMPRERDGADAFMSQITLGTTALFDYFTERGKKKEFEKSREKIMSKLEQMK